MSSSCAAPWKHHWMAAVSRSRSVSYSLPNRLSCVICSTTASLPKSPAIKPVLPWWQSFCKTQIKEKSCRQNMISFVILSNRNILFRLHDFSFFITYKTGLVKNPLIAFYFISDKASSSATMITLGWSLKTEPGTCGVIGPFTTAFNASALSFPLTTSRIAFARRIVPTPIV